jgi:hypothetical protein
MLFAPLLIAPLALAAGMVASRASRDIRRVAAVAAGLLLALVVFDLLPDAVSDGHEAGVPAVLVLGLVLSIAVGAGGLLERPDAAGCCRTGRAGAAALATHGLLEGAVLGAGLGLDRAAGPLLLAAFAGHKAAEGAMLVGFLRTAPAGRARLALPAVAAVAPAAGVLAGSFVALPALLASCLTVVLTGLLAAVAVLQLRQAAARPSTGVLAGLATGGMVLVLQWAGA